MQINFEPEKIKAAKAYVDRLTPIEFSKNERLDIPSQQRTQVDGEFYSSHQKTSLIKKILNFLFK